MESKSNLELRVIVTSGKDAQRELERRAEASWDKRVETYINMRKEMCHAKWDK